jgi:hypothetical protein
MTTSSPNRPALTARTAFIGFCVIAAVILIYEHTMHVLGALPFLLLLACRLMHVFMHHGHGAHHPNTEVRPGMRNMSPQAAHDLDRQGPGHA